MSGKSYIVVLQNLKIDESTAEFLIFEQIKYLQLYTMDCVYALEINKNNKHTLTIYRVFSLVAVPSLDDTYSEYDDCGKLIQDHNVVF
jgi:hypothetical protein